MLEFITEFIRSDPKFVLAIFALLITTFSASLTLTVRKINENNRFLDKLEADSNYQISENLKNIERILSETIAEIPGRPIPFALRKALDEYPNIPNINVSSDDLDRLSKPFAEMCANLDKYKYNVIRRKGFCMKFQEHGNYARRLLSLFEKAGFESFTVGFPSSAVNRVSA